MPIIGVYATLFGFYFVLFSKDEKTQLYLYAILKITKPSMGMDNMWQNAHKSPFLTVCVQKNAHKPKKKIFMGNNDDIICSA